MFLWVLYAYGDSVLLAPLLIPAVIGVMVALGVALNRYIGVDPHKQHFDDGVDEGEQ
jgi:hypothetical protein